MSQTIHRSDYRAPTHLLEDIQLEFDLNAEETLVTSTFTARPNPESKDSSGELHLNGESLTLKSVEVDGQLLGDEQFKVDAHGLIIPGINGKKTVKIINTMSPSANLRAFAASPISSIDRMCLPATRQSSAVRRKISPLCCQTAI